MVESIPPGRVMSYGAIAEWLYDRFGKGSARRIGTIMSQYGGSVPWYRVVSGGGRLPPGHEAAARARLEAEGVSFAKIATPMGQSGGSRAARGKGVVARAGQSGTSQRVKMADYAWWPGDVEGPDGPRGDLGR